MTQWIKILLLWVFLFSSLTLSANGDEIIINSHTCDFPAIFNFGDWNSDTGGMASAFHPKASPYGETYFHGPSGRSSDGRLIIDFLADHLELPYLSPYLDSVGSIYRHGANFAAGGATIMPPNESWFQYDVSPFNLEIQVEQFAQFKAKVAYVRHQDKKDYLRKRLPRPKRFPKSLFIVDIGQNDVVLGLHNSSFEALQPAISNMVNQFITQLRNLYQLGARTFWIHNIGPIGCLPLVRDKVREPLDDHGCVKSHNNAASEFNKQLKDSIVGLRTELFEAAITYVDMYSAKYELITDADNHGFDDPFKICCGYHGTSYDVWCGKRAKLNGSEVFAGSCPYPSRVISWDGVHYTEAANRWIAKRIVTGLLSDPPVAITKACHRQIGILESL